MRERIERYEGDLIRVSSNKNSTEYKWAVVFVVMFLREWPRPPRTKRDLEEELEVYSGGRLRWRAFAGVAALRHILGQLLAAFTLGTGKMASLVWHQLQVK
ncbi:uncharacterized protein EV422DRAFT_564127 [Fimicolochytrium jonesii]|uniref:uncharacterized protein n=1 Tax=Fimicolochytrium jonesii TaxID=1396493 RepID=UPI0022FF106B|nr:uncharacterized protein EV422DRAFT_564127 [Fimicolochytrium jonesii]KAI8824799.1 hypothetical protein EV422DRAFT_564127 [Fimicolochytrium jonesii]